MPKDLFSSQAKTYARYRPGYPKELFAFLNSICQNHDLAWDCATGNGQAAVGLSSYFKNIIATDISQRQLDHAIQKDNIQYQTGSAENSGLPDKSFDLITVAQAYHWINREAFHKEATRVGKRDAVVAVWMYNRLLVNDKALMEIYEDFYFNVTGPYWDAERKYVDENYETVDFNFCSPEKKQFNSIVNWNREEFIGYLSSWSAVQKFQNINGYSPVDLIKQKLENVWPGDETKEMIFPVFMRYGFVC